MDAAKFAFDRKDYKTASTKAQASYATLSDISEFAPLPGKYTVRLIPERRDCLWRIAEYGFVYNNPLKWPVLYEANKRTFKDPSNPNLIYPGQVLVIPSIKGETREGMWNPNKTYQSLAK
ncbi:MAG: LysM peptidoglycan-binding domain-containing protein [Spirochaetes bacterium]|nr:LysM peptidoglycan-binding domain-containing protein [Spirochaetota bacterium]